MILSLKNDNKKVFLVFLFILINTVLFRKFSTIWMILFAFYCILQYKSIALKLKKEHLPFIILIMIPILLEIAFFWNNDSFSDGFKALEKTLCCLLLPVIIIVNKEYIKPHKILSQYAFITLVILLISLVLFYFFQNNYFEKYLRGIHLWQMGYQFSRFIGIHAPALNMYISYICILFVYFVTLNFQENKKITKKLITLAFFFGISFIFLLIVNTRIALFTFAINLILLFFNLKFKLIQKIVILFFVLLFTSVSVYLFSKKFPFIIEKYTTQITKNLDKINKLDQIENPEVEVYSSLVTRLSIWNSSLELANDNFLIGVGSSDAKKELTKYYKETNQVFLGKFGFITHNQMLNYYLKFGIIGLLCCLIYLFYPLYLFFKTKEIVILFFFINFFISNITDDYLNKFDGIVYSVLWYSVFSCFYLNKIK